MNQIPSERRARLLMVNTLFPLMIVTLALVSVKPGIDRSIIAAGNAHLWALTVFAPAEPDREGTRALR